jgi:hypothetical protein
MERNETVPRLTQKSTSVHNNEDLDPGGKNEEGQLLHFFRLHAAQTACENELFFRVHMIMSEKERKRRR